MEGLGRPGYAYIYISNERDELVYFDNLLLTHERGRVLEENHYYPFGLTMAGISSKAAGSLENRYKFNEGTERITDLDLNWDETDFRGYDAQIGRFLQIDELANLNYDFSPYVYANNNPISLNDPFGLIAEDAIAANAMLVVPKPIYKTLPEVVVVGHRKKKSSVGQPGFAENFIPVWGSGRAAVDDFQNGRWGWGIFNSLMTVADVVTLGGASTLVKGGVKTLIKIGTKEAVGEATEVLVTTSTRTFLLNEGINITQEGFMHFMKGHYLKGFNLNKSKFTMEVRDIVNLIKNSAQVPKTVLSNSGNFQRVVDAGRIVGIDGFTKQPTSLMTIITNAAGDLQTAFPGVLK